MHSAYSDGLLSPEALCALALQKKLTTIALCDHDTTDGLAPMAEMVSVVNRQQQRLTFLPSVELSTGAEGRTHVLGYGVNPANVALQQELATLRVNRVARGQRMVQALAKLGISIPDGYVPDAEANRMPIGRPHVARALIRMGVVNTMEQAFDRYLAEGKPAYVPLEHLSTSQAARLLTDAGAVPVLAHPMRIGLEPQALEALVIALQANGLQGVEVFHPSASHGQVRALEAMARRHSLLVTGGSDFHGDHGSRASMGDFPAGWHTWQNDLALLLAAMQAAQGRMTQTVGV